MIHDRITTEKYTLILGDCLDVLPTLEAGSVDAVVTDPPYGIVNKFGDNIQDDGGVRTMQFEWDCDGVTDNVVLPAIRLMLQVARKSAACFVFCGCDQFGGVLDVVRGESFTAKPAAWVKAHPPPAGLGNWWPSGFEIACYGYRNGPYFGDDDPKRSNVFVSDSYRYGQPGKVDHPTQKPLGLIMRIVRAIVPPEGAAVDGFMGSGTTGVACMRLGRRFIGIEKTPKYFAIAAKRIKEAAESMPLFEPQEQARQMEMF